MAATDWRHSAKTVNSGIFRGPPEPDWFGFIGFPLRPGVNTLRTLERAHRAMNPATAVETTGIAPGLGPWRPDMSAYTDERTFYPQPATQPNGFTKLGL